MKEWDTPEGKRSDWLLYVEFALWLAVAGLGLVAAALLLVTPIAASLLAG